MPAKPVIFITEGDSDDVFLKGLLNFRQVGGWEIKSRPKGGEKGGINYFREQLKSIRGAKQDYQKFNEIVLVADNDSDTGFEAVMEEIRWANLERPADDQFGVPDAPRQPAQVGQTLPPVSILMLPWDAEEGCLETLCLKATNKKYAEFLHCAETMAACVKASDWDISPKSKLVLRCLLASICRQNPNTGLQHAWKTDKGRPGDIFPWDSQVFDQIANYLA